jgi:hypothetical protein
MEQTRQVVAEVMTINHQSQHDVVAATILSAAEIIKVVNNQTQQIISSLKEVNKQPNAVQEGGVEQQHTNISG